MDSLHELYRVGEDNLCARRVFIGLGGKDVAALRRLHGWAKKAVPEIVSAFYDHQFAFPATVEFFGAFARREDKTEAELRQGLERAQQT